MAKLRDLVNVEANIDHIDIQGVQIPIMFSMGALDYIQEAYGKPYPQFEADLNRMMQQKEIRINHYSIKIMRALIYGMVRAADTECTLKDLEGAIPVSQIADVYTSAFDVFLNGNFQEKDLETVKKPVKQQKKTHNQKSKHPKK